MDATRKVAKSLDIAAKVGQLHQKRTKLAQEHFRGTAVEGLRRLRDGSRRKPRHSRRLLVAMGRVRHRLRAALGPVLGHAAPARQQLPRARAGGQAAGAALRLRDGARRRARWSGRSTTRWCASCRPKGVTVDPKRRPYVIIDPRAGHGPGIGGFKDDSQVGVALRDGHPVYFVIFFREPEPGPDAARRVRRPSAVRARRCASCIRTAPKPVDRRQLPGRLGGDDARRRQSRRHRPDRDQRRADVVLGRRLERGRGRQPDALCRRPARRHLARLAHGRPRQRHVRRRLAGAELREPRIRPTPSGTSTTTSSPTSTPSRRASSSSSAGGAAST